MTLDNFIADLDRYGGDLSRWPEARRRAAEALLGQGPGEAWRHYRAANFVEVNLRKDMSVAQPVLLQQILDAARSTPEPEAGLAQLFGFWPRSALAGALCASLAAGLFFGWSSSPASSLTGQAGYDDVPGLTWSPGETGGMMGG